MTIEELQGLMFQSVRSRIAKDDNLVDQVARVLNISTDSAYRRIRGDKALSLEEAGMLCKSFHLSLDSLMQLQPDSFRFTGSFVQPSAFDFGQWLKQVLQQVKYMSGFREREMFYLCKDIPIFHHFHYRELAAFKHYVWMKGISNDPAFLHKKFRIDDYPDEYFELGRKALSLYNGIDSVEIWNLESINSTMRQVDFYHECGLFADVGEVVRIYEALEKLLVHLDRQAGSGAKYMAGDEEAGARFRMYFNEIVIGDNSVLGVLDGSMVGFIVHTVFNVMTTTDIGFTANMHESLQNLMKKSTLISSVSERERARFFKYLRRRIAHRKERINA